MAALLVGGNGDWRSLELSVDASRSNAGEMRRSARLCAPPVRLTINALRARRIGDCLTYPLDRNTQ